MSVSSFWEQPGVSVDQLPTLQDLLASCDRDKFLDVVLPEYAARAFGAELLSPKRCRTAKRRLSLTLDAMCDLPVRKKRNRLNILLPAERFVLRAESGLIERRVVALLAPDGKDLGMQVAFGASPQAASGFPRETKPLYLGSLLEPRGYALDPWEDSLAFRVWLGGPWCCCERYLMLANAFWELTYYGFEYDRVVANQFRAKAAECAGSKGLDRDKADCDAFGSPESVTQRGVWFGLTEPDGFQVAYAGRIASRVEALNQEALADFWERFASLRIELGKT